jgi:DNA-binding transcriptional LysR family regulator
MDTRTLAAFVAAADAGSLSLAARRLGRELSGLSEVGAPLLERTGRGVRLTPGGEQYLEHARASLKELELGQASLRARVPRQQSSLRLSGPPDLVQSILTPALPQLLAEFPAMRLEVRGETRKVAVVEESFDAVIRLGALAPSELLARRLGGISRAIYGTPTTPDDAEFVLCEGMPSELFVTSRGRKRQLPLPARLRVSSLADAGQLAARGLGLVILPSIVAVPFLRSGQLVRRAKQLALPATEAHLLRLARHRGNAILDRMAALLEASIARAEADAAALVLRAEPSGARARRR